MVLSLDPAAPLRRVAVHGSRFLHYCREGWSLTLCGQVAVYRGVGMPKRDDCRRCQNEAHAHGIAMPK